MKLVLLIALITSTRYSQATFGAVHSRSPVLTFAGGFGGSKSKIKSKNVKKKNKKRALADMAKPSAAPAATSTSPKLDKWGLPEATLDDVFPPLPEGTELIPVEDNKEYSLEEIQHCLRDHMDLNLSSCFDNNGVEIMPKHNEDDNLDRQPMKLKLLHQSPPVLSIEHFFTSQECTTLQKATATAHKINSATFQGALSTRTSTSWFCHYKDVPVLLAKANQRLNINLLAMEEPQIVRYRKGQEFSWHYDEVPAEQLKNGGQRLATLLVYLNDIDASGGGGTTFRDLNSSQGNKRSLVMQPQCGSALLFFPAFADGRPDDRTLHKSEVMTCDEEKWIVQMWIHQRDYQAVVPAGNSNEAAKEAMAEASRKLGYE